MINNFVAQISSLHFRDKEPLLVHIMASNIIEAEDTAETYAEEYFRAADFDELANNIGEDEARYEDYGLVDYICHEWQYKASNEEYREWLEDENEKLPWFDAKLEAS